MKTKQRPLDLCPSCQMFVNATTGHENHTVAETCNCKRYNQGRIRGVEREYDVGHQATAWRQDGNASLANVHMDTVVEKSCDAVAQKWR